MCVCVCVWNTRAHIDLQVMVAIDLQLIKQADSLIQCPNEPFVDLLCVAHRYVRCKPLLCVRVCVCLCE